MDWNNLTTDQKTEALKDQLKQTIDRFNRILHEQSSEIGSLNARVKDLTAQIEEIQRK